ncbi:hypothetical protein D3C81_810340 [compost metagenome]
MAPTLASAAQEWQALSENWNISPIIYLWRISMLFSVRFVVLACAVFFAAAPCRTRVGAWLCAIISSVHCGEWLRNSFQGGGIG